MSQYPAGNHTFILREIRTLRTLGFEIRVVSIRKPDRLPELLSDEEADEYQRTFAVLGGSDLRLIVSHALYFAEAVVAGEYFTRAGVRHFHPHFSSTVSLIVARLFGLPFSITLHGSGEFNDVVGFHMAETGAGAGASKSCAWANWRWPRGET